MTAVMNGVKDRHLLVAALASMAVAVLSCVILAAAAEGGPAWSAAMPLILYLFAASGVAGTLGLVFGLPRGRTEVAGVDTERYSSNDNLEQISDWLTKILVGAGLVQLSKVPSWLSALGDFLGDELEIPNGSAIAVAVVIYGFGSGFVFVYLWARLRLRALLESSERRAEEQSRRVAAALSLAVAESTTTESDRSINLVAARATATVDGAGTLLSPVLWV